MPARNYADTRCGKRDRAKHSENRPPPKSVSPPEKGKSQADLSTWLLFICRQRPTLPHTFACSTIGPAGLNFRVRDGNGWNPRGNITDKLDRAFGAKLIWLLSCQPFTRPCGAECQVPSAVFKDREDEASQLNRLGDFSSHYIGFSSAPSYQSCFSVIQVRTTSKQIAGSSSGSN